MSGFFPVQKRNENDLSKFQGDSILIDMIYCQWEQLQVTWVFFKKKEKNIHTAPYFISSHSLSNRIFVLHFIFYVYIACYLFESQIEYSSSSS